MWKCPKCETVNRDEYNYCIICGALKGTSSFYCSECGSEVEEQAKFCKTCGTEIDLQEQGGIIPAYPKAENPAMGKELAKKKIAMTPVPGYGLSIASLVLGIVTLIYCLYGSFVLGIVGLVLGIIGRQKLHVAGQPTGKAIAGIICSIIGLVISLGLLAIIIFILVTEPL